jgi:hypothetical protein
VVVYWSELGLQVEVQVEVQVEDGAWHDVRHWRAGRRVHGTRQLHEVYLNIIATVAMRIPCVSHAVDWKLKPGGLSDHDGQRAVEVCAK